MSLQFKVEHVIDCTPEEFWEHVHFRSDFLQFMFVEELGHSYEILEENKETGARRTKIMPKVDLPGPVRKLVGNSFDMEEVGQLDQTDKVYRFKIIPGAQPDRIQTTAEMQILPHEGGRCIRSVEFDINVRFAGLGGIVERVIKSQTTSGYDESAGLTNTWLQRIGVGVGAAS